MGYFLDCPRSRPGEWRKVEHHVLELPVKCLLPFLRGEGAREGGENSYNLWLTVTIHDCQGFRALSHMRTYTRTQMHTYTRTSMQLLLTKRGETWRD